MTQAVVALSGAHDRAPTGFLPVMSRRSLFDRSAIEARIEALICLLDRIDGDSDFEPDHEDYDVCDLYEGGDHTSEPLQYGIDQSAGPVNVKGYVPHTGPDFTRLFGAAA